MNVLVDELLLEIFNYLDAKSLKKCCEVSQRFNEIISFNKSTMRKLPLFINESSVAKNPDVINFLSRNYNTIIFDNISMAQNQKLVNDLLKNNVFGSVKAIEMIDLTINQQELMKILKKLSSSLEKILIVNSRVNYFQKRNLIDIISLRTIVFIDSSFEFLEFIGKSELDLLKIHCNRYGASKNSIISDEEILEEFLMRTSSLKSIAVRVQQGKIYETLLNNNEREYTFKLRQLSVVYNSFGSGESADENFIQLLKQHESTLEHLEIDCKLTEETYEYVFGTLKLKSLRLDASTLPDKYLFYNSIMTNNCLKKLVISKAFRSQNAVLLFRIYKSIQDLTITQWTNETSNEILSSIVNNLNLISTLSIPEIPKDATEIPMPSLQKLHIESLHVESIANFQSFISHHVNIKNLSVKWIHQELTYGAMYGILTRLRNLEMLSFGPTFKPTLRLYGMMKQNAKNLRKINIFRFPDEPMDKVLENDDQIKTHYFTHKSSSLIFKSEKGFWDDEDLYLPTNNLLDNLIFEVDGEGDSDLEGDSDEENDFFFGLDGDYDMEDDFDFDPFA